MVSRAAMAVALAISGLALFLVATTKTATTVPLSRQSPKDLLSVVTDTGTPALDRPVGAETSDVLDAGKQSTRLLCTPFSVPLMSRVSFPKLALDLHTYHHSKAPPGSSPRRPQDSGPLTPTTRRPFRAVEIGSLYCVNLFSFRTVVKAYAPTGLPVEFFSVDSWGYRGKEEGLPDQNDEKLGRKAFLACQALLAAGNFSDTRLVRGLSAQAAQQFDDGFFDFIYIDALHTYAACKADMDAWWPKLRPGGLFAGDDYGDYTLLHLASWERHLRHHRWGVVRAVREFAVSRNLDVHTTSHEHKLHPRIAEKLPRDVKGARGIDASFFSPTRGVPNWYLIKPSLEYDGTCRTLVNNETWLSKFEPRRGDDGASFSPLPIEPVAVLPSGWTRIRIDTPIPHLVYVPESVAQDADEVEEGGTGSSSCCVRLCSVLLYLHDVGEAGEQLRLLLNKRSGIGTPAQLLELRALTFKDVEYDHPLFDAASAQLSSSSYPHPLLNGSLASTLVIAPQSRTGWMNDERGLTAVEQMIRSWSAVGQRSNMNCSGFPNDALALCSRIAVDPTRIIVTGAGVGGYGALALAARNAAGSTFVALSPMLRDMRALAEGVLSSTTSIRSSRRRSPRIAILHGSNDVVVRQRNSSEFLAHLREVSGSRKSSQQLTMETVHVEAKERLTRDLLLSRLTTRNSSSVSYPDVLFVDMDRAPSMLTSPAQKRAMKKNGKGHATWRVAFSATSPLWTWL